jgi:quercetin dioxygenase-like cupin family protein
MRAVDLFDTPVAILEDGTVSVGEDAGASVRSGEDGVIVADLAPGVRMKVGAVKMTESSKHRGERHPEGDELVYLVSGSVGVSFEHSDVEEADVVGLRPGELVVVPRGMWHRLVVEEPSELIFMTPGCTEVRRA